MTFALYGKSCALSRLHCDAEGVATAVRIETSSKVWAIMTSRFEEEGHPTASIKNWKGWFSCHWDVAFLEPGDTM
jgi:hypothetical protein